MSEHTACPECGEVHSPNPIQHSYDQALQYAADQGHQIDPMDFLCGVTEALALIVLVSQDRPIDRQVIDGLLLAAVDFARDNEARGARALN